MLITALRSALFMVLLALATVITLLALVCGFWLSQRTRRLIVVPYVNVVMFLIRHLLGIRHQIIGAENIPATPCVILSKHQSAWETLAFQLIFPPQVYVMKRELLWIPFFGWGLAMTSPIAINRSAGREALKQLVKLGKQRLASGLWVVVFPEGTRIAPNQHGKFHIGGAWLASGAKATVLPVAHNAGHFWAKNSMLKHPGTITVSIGQAIDCSHLKPDAVNTQVEAWIKAEMANLAIP